MKIRSVALAMTLLTGGAVIGATTQHFASATVSSGARAVLVPIEPCRLADTRPAPDNVGPRPAPLAAGDTHTIDAQQSGVPCTGMIPTDASALSLNITALGATAQSYLTVWAGGERPLAASLNPAPGQPPVPNAVTTELSVDQEFRIYNDAGSVNVVVDVNGYYVDHDHDDRYYTKEQVDAAVEPPPAPDAVQLNPWGLNSDDEWVYGKGIAHDASGDLGCTYTPIDGQAGRYATSIDLTYVGSGGTDVSIQVLSVSSTAGELNDPEWVLIHLAAAETLPATNGSSVTVSVPHGLQSPQVAVPTADGARNTFFSLCTRDQMGVVGLTVNFSDAAPSRPASSASSVDEADVLSMLQG